VVFDRRIFSAIRLRLAPVARSALIAYGPEEAQKSASVYRAVQRARGRDVDLAIASCALVNGAALWTLNVRDFADIPGLRLVAK